MRTTHINLPGTLKERLAQGHPWVYRDQLPALLDLPDGAPVRVQAGNFAAIGLWARSGAIAVRLFSRATVPDAGWVRAQVAAALRLRQAAGLAVADGATDCYRLLYGEGDGLPGIVLDIYGAWAVLRAYTPSVAHLVPWVVDAVRELLPLQGVVMRGEGQAGEGRRQKAEDGRRRTEDGGRRTQAERGLEVLWGTQPPAGHTVRENGLIFQADLELGQKTGLFLDQRDNRRTLQSWCAGKRVLNCFGYTGGFSLYALAGDARHATTVDIARPAIEAANANVALNGFSLDRHTGLVADCFDLLERYAGESRLFDVVVLDPPSFARSRDERHAALRAYTRLNTLGIRCVQPGGLLATASCSSQVDPEAFRVMLGAAAAQARRTLQIIHEAGHPADHPVPAGFPEGRYLKFILARVLNAP